jgi:hypothetical protein
MSKYGDMIVNQQWLIGQKAPNWYDLAGGREEWESTDEDRNFTAKRSQYERSVYRLMRKRAKIPYPFRKYVNGSLVKIRDETYTERWLVHYYNLRHFQPCRQVASFVAGRLSGEYHEGNDVSFELDLVRLCQARQILDRVNLTVNQQKQKGQTV